MDTLQKCAERIISDHLINTKNGLIICDSSHAELANTIRNVLLGAPADIECCIVKDRGALDKAFNRCLRRELKTLVLVEPTSFVGFEVFNWLDLDSGMPKIRGLHAHSYVSILPIDSTLRVYGSEPSQDQRAKKDLLSSLKPNSDYVILTDSGTELYFTSRHWIDQGNEVLTAPVEQSVKGIIAVDGAVFFQKVDTVIDCHIEAGEIIKIEARDEKGNELVGLYKDMTKRDFANRINRQLAEVGLGCNTGAAIGDCFMESEMAYGTAHFCFGNNVCYGGQNKSSFHGGSVLIKAPRVLELSPGTENSDAGKNNVG